MHDQAAVAGGPAERGIPADQPVTAAAQGCGQMLGLAGVLELQSGIDQQGCGLPHPFGLQGHKLHSTAPE
jgi:hypothetical protein